MKTKCRNCGDLTTRPQNEDYERSKLGWCASCIRFARKANPDDRYWAAFIDRVVRQQEQADAKK